MLIVNSNLTALNTANQLNINTNKKNKSIEKLSSGYRINKAADDTAGLAISEKMRYMIRGLNQGSKNVEDGISWVQTGDGALNEAHDILHRMTELTIQSLNDTNTELDRKALQMEFESLQSELDRIGQTTQFNDMPIFEEHDGPYYQCEGNIRWDPQQIHVVTAGDNDLTFTYRMDDSSPTQTISISVPPGEYTTQELVDEIETVLGNAPAGDEKIIFEYTPEGTCNVNLERAENLDCVSGGLSYLLNQVYRGGGFGALIGTTIFPTEYSELEVKQGQNNFMSFTIENFAGSKQTQTIDIPDGDYTRSELIDILNAQLAGTTVKATAYGTGIRLASDDSIVTGFKGNMFKIDGNGKIYDSVFYDNVKYGSSIQTAAVFTGGCVLPTNTRDEEHKYYIIDNTNNTLILQPNGMTSPVTITIDPGKYTASEMRDKLNPLFALAGVAVRAEVITSGSFQGLKITSTEKGLNSAINMDDTCSAYNTLFITREYNQYGTQAKITNETQADQDGSFTGSKDLLPLPAAPLTVTAGVNDSFQISINDTNYTVSVTATTYSNIDDIVDELNERLNGASAPMAYKGKVIADKTSDGKIILKGQDGQAVDKIRVSANGNNGGYDAIFRGSTTTSTSQNASGTGSVTLNTPFDGTIDPSDSNLTINVDGKNHTVTLPTGNVTQDQIINAIQNAIPPKTETTPNRFPTVSANGSTTDHNFNLTSSGSQSSVPWSDSAKGSGDKVEGIVDYINPKPAEMTVGPALKDNMVVDDSNDKITLTSNGKTETITLDHKPYTPDSLMLDLQHKIDKVFGEAMGGIIVGLKGNQLTLTSRLPKGANPNNTSIACSTANSSFLKDLNTTKQPATLTSSRPLVSTIAIDSSNNTFQFQFKEHGVSQTVNLTLSNNTYSPSTLADEINRQLQQQNIAVTASVSNGRLMLKSAATGNDTSISYNTKSGGNSAEALFGPMIEEQPATALVNMDTQESISIEAGKTDQFAIIVNGQNKSVTLDSGTYDRAGFLEMLNKKLENSGVTASYSGNKLQYQTTGSGSQTSIYMNYDYGGSAMKQIYGETTTTYPGVTASFTSNGLLTLGSTDPNSKITISSSGGGAFQKPTVTPVPIEPTYKDGYHSSKQSRVDGVALNGDITIDQWNDHLQFQFTDSGTVKSASFDIPQGTYSYAELQSKVQSLVDAELGAGTVNVTVDASGVKLVAAKTGNNYKFSSFSGDFYDKVMCQCTEQSINQKTQNKDGEQKVDPAYTVGRKDVKNEGADIRKGINDQLSLDLTYGNQLHKIEITLDQGHYSGEQLKDHLQEKINEQLADKGFEKNMIEVALAASTVESLVPMTRTPSTSSFQIKLSCQMKENLLLTA